MANAGPNDLHARRSGHNQVPKVNRGPRPVPIDLGGSCERPETRAAALRPATRSKFGAGATSCSRGSSADGAHQAALGQHLVQGACARADPDDHDLVF